MTIIVFDPETGDIEQAAEPADYAAKEKRLREEGKSFESFPFMKIAGSIAHFRLDPETRRLVKRSETLAELRTPLLQRLKQHHGLAAQEDFLFSPPDGGKSGAVADDARNLPARQLLVDGGARAQAAVAGFALRIRAGQKAPHGGFWRLKDNSRAALSDKALLALDDALSARNAEMQERAWKLADAIRAETDPAKLKGFDIAAAWDAAAEAGA